MNSRYVARETKRKICEVCEDNSSIYKCPKCEIRYCSVKCFKNHKESGCSPVKTSVKEINNDNKKYGFETEDTVPLEKLKLLSEDPELKDMLANPHLQDMLKNIMATCRSKDITAAMQIPIFQEFVNKCLKIVEPEAFNIP